jgi:hypothetical protein
MISVLIADLRAVAPACHACEAFDHRREGGRVLSEQVHPDLGEQGTPAFGRQGIERPPRRFCRVDRGRRSVLHFRASRGV